MTVIRDRSQPTYVGSIPSMTVGKMYWYVDMGPRDSVNAGASYPFPEYAAAVHFLERQNSKDCADGFPDREYEINEHIHAPTENKEKH